MADEPLSPIPEAVVVPKRRTRISLVWIIPIVAAVAGIWIFATKVLNEGPDITIEFSSAEGIEPNKTKIYYRGLSVGTVTDIGLAKDGVRVHATARMTPSAKVLLFKDTQFWVVKPRVSGLNISGLGTLISGNYIALRRGESQETERKFTALDSPPTTADVPGKYFVLKTAKLGSLGEGTPVVFRQLPVGQMVSYELDPSQKFLNLKIFIEAPYDRLISSDTRFWQASGVDISLTTSGLRVLTESLMSIIAGAIAFETPTNSSPPQANRETFDLFNDRADAFKPEANDRDLYLLVFNQSARGLSAGAPVELGGMVVGEVTQVSPLLNATNGELTVLVTACVAPERYGVRLIDTPAGMDGGDQHRSVMSNFVARGMRAQLKTGNFLTGSMLISLDFNTNAPAATIDWSQSPVQLPTDSGKAEGLENNVNVLLNNVNSTVQLLGTKLTNTLAGIDGVARELTNTLVGARGMVTNANTLLGSANKLIEPNSVFNAELNNLLLQGGDAARALRVLADYLERHPEALIRGKNGEVKK